MSGDKYGSLESFNLVRATNGHDAAARRAQRAASIARGRVFVDGRWMYPSNPLTTTTSDHPHNYTSLDDSNDDDGEDDGARTRFVGTTALGMLAVVGVAVVALSNSGVAPKIDFRLTGGASESEIDFVGIVDPASGAEIFADEDCATYQSICLDVLAPAVGGYDVVSFFSLRPNMEGRLGSEAFTTLYAGNTYFFISEENKALFDADPESYLPQFGGFCAFGVAVEDVWADDCIGPVVEPATEWLVKDGKLYLMRGAAATKNVASDPLYIQQAEANWEAWFGGGGDEDAAVNPVNTLCTCSNSDC